MRRHDDLESISRMRRQSRGAETLSIERELVLVKIIGLMRVIFLDEIEVRIWNGGDSN